MRVAVVGVGAIGGTYAAHLARLGTISWTFCVRRPFDDLVVRRVDGSLVGTVSGTVLTDARAAEPVDLVLLATKGHQVDGVGDWLDALVGEATTVLVLQNGVEHADRVGRHLGDGQLVPALVYVGGYVEQPGRIVTTNVGPTVLPDSEPGRELAVLLTSVGLPGEVTTDFLTDSWRKLAVNIAASPTTAAYQVPAAAVGRIPVIREVAGGLVDECVAVGRALGARLDPGTREAVLDELADYPLHVTASMCRDRAAGRELEIDPLLGAVVRGGVRTGVPTPHTSAMIDLLQGMAALPLGR